MGIFRPDSKFAQLAGKLADLMILNLLTLLCCLPLITVGASVTAMHQVLLKILRDEEGAITRQFFRAFRENFRQSTLILLIYTAIALLLVLDYRLCTWDALKLPPMFKYLLFGAALLVLFSYTWVFVLQSRYRNKVRQTIRNSFWIGISQLLYTVMMVLLDILPILVLYKYDNLILAVLLLGFTVPGLLKAMLYSRVFHKLEGTEGGEDTRQ